MSNSQQTQKSTHITYLMYIPIPGMNDIKLQHVATMKKTNIEYDAKEEKKILETMQSKMGEDEYLLVAQIEHNGIYYQSTRVTPIYTYFFKNQKGVQNTETWKTNQAKNNQIKNDAETKLMAFLGTLRSGGKSSKKTSKSQS